MDFTELLYWSPTGVRLSFTDSVRNVTFAATQGVTSQLYSDGNVMSFVLAKRALTTSFRYNGATSGSITTPSRQDFIFVKFASRVCAPCPRGTAKSFVSLNETCPICPAGTYSPDIGAIRCTYCDGFSINDKNDCLSLATFIGIIIGCLFVVVASILFVVMTVALCVVQIIHERSSVSYQRTKTKSQMLLYD